ncbi:MAG TPA: HAMP domain-containing protein, partial [Candidatus Binatia bacterium]|nr:HAMP domain-containing protein [Candidatus Binatia bacterium]
MRRKFTLGQRVALGASTLVLFVLAASALGFWHVRASARTLDASQDSVRQISRLADLESSWSKISSTLDRMLLTRQTNMIDEDLARERAVFDEALSTLADQPFGNEANTIAENVELVADLQFLGSELDDLVDQIQVEARQRHWPQAQVLRHAELAALQRRFEGRLEQLRSNTSEEINSLVALSARRQRATSVFLTIGLAVAAILGAVFTLVAVRAITDPINQLIDRTRRVTEGDFTYVTPLQRDDEIGVLSTSFSIMTE